MQPKEILRQTFILMTENYKSIKVKEHAVIIEKVLQIENDNALVLLNTLSDKFVKKATRLE